MLSNTVQKKALSQRVLKHTLKEETKGVPKKKARGGDPLIRSSGGKKCCRECNVHEVVAPGEIYAKVGG